MKLLYILLIDTLNVEISGKSIINFGWVFLIVIIIVIILIYILNANYRKNR